MTETAALLKIEHVDPATLVPAKYNPRTISDAQRLALRASIEAFGLVEPIIARRGGEVIGGHQRLTEALDAELDTVPVIFLDEISDVDAKRLNLALNKIGGDWQPDKLAALMTELAAVPGLDLSVTGFTLPERRRLVLDDRNKGVDLEAVPPTRDPRSEPGDLWALGDHRLLVGDCTVGEDVDRLLGDKLVDLFACDPPYAIYGSATGIGSEMADDKMVRPMFLEVLRLAASSVKMFGHVYICCDWRSWASWWEMAKRAELTPKNLIMWDKGSGGLGSSYSNSYELVGFWSKLPKQRVMKGKNQTGQRQVHQPNIWRGLKVPGGEREHNAQKPVGLFRYLIENSSDPGDVVFDPFVGSGTMIVACEATDRRCFAMDVDPKFADVALARWELLTGGTAEKVTP